jgi:transcriptional regulator with XRE-family HTH domain
METQEIQQQFFTHLRQTLPAHLSLVDELCELLDISPDSVYRRLRGEKPVTLDELKKICDHYQLSMDQLLQLKNESVLFQAPGLNTSSNDFIDYLKGNLALLKYFNSFKNMEFYYNCKDMTFWSFYLFPEMASFKTFFWTKTLNNHSELRDKPFSYAEYPYTDCYATGQLILQEYNKMTGVELWNLESINSTINQISYYKEAGLFKTEDDFDMVISSFIKTLDHIQLEVEKGYKFLPGATDVAYKQPFRFYVNELVLGSNNMLVNLEDRRIAIITHSVFNPLLTTDARFTEKSYNHFHTLLSRSTLISGTGEKDRNRFFNALRSKVNSLRKMVNT